MTSFWSMWVIVLTTITLVGLTWILFANRKGEQKTGDQTTGHEYDGIEEYDNPLPAWWFYMFVITIVWGVGYLVIYPGMGNFSGLLNWTQLSQHEREVSAADEKFRAMRDRYLALPVEEIAGDPAVRKMGMRMFGNNCAGNLFLVGNRSSVARARHQPKWPAHRQFACPCIPNRLFAKAVFYRVDKVQESHLI